MGQLGSPSSPSFAGWQQHSVQGYQFASKYTSPAQDVYIQQIHAYFSASVASAVGYVVVWNGSTGAIIQAVGIGTMSVGSNSPGGQAWRVANLTPPGVLLPASTPIWIGGYSRGGIVWSTYDTTPNTYQDNTGNTSNPTAFSGSNTSQGPCGAYIIYSPINSGSPRAMGGQGLLLVQSSKVILNTGQDKMGGSGGLLVPNTNVLNPTGFLVGGSGGLAPIDTTVKHPLIKIWRPL